MPVNFLHGAEILRKDTGPRFVRLVPTSIIGLVCTAPVHLVDSANRTVNTPVLIQSADDAAAYLGPDLAGYTGRFALESILDQGMANVVVVNVFDPTTHKTAVTAESVTLNADGYAVLAHAGVLNVVVKDSTGTTTHVLNTDYTLDATTATVTRKTGGAIAAGATLKVTYDYGDPSQVDAADIIGTVTVGGVKTGWQAMLDVPLLFGFTPKNLICPGYCTDDGVAAEMLVKAGELLGHALIDAPIGTTYANAISGRGPSGSIAGFYTQDPRAVLCYPHMKVADPAGGTRLAPLSQLAAGVWARTDLDEGFWASPSNHEIRGVLGLEIPITGTYGDPNSQANTLNSNGIVTVLRDFGTGYVLWGNRSAAWPANTHPRNFISVLRTEDVVDESLLKASLQFNDKPINVAELDSLRETGNRFLATIVQQGGLLRGSEITWDKSKNPAIQLANGQVVLSKRMMPPVPAERISYESWLDVDLYNNLFTSGVS